MNKVQVGYLHLMKENEPLSFLYVVVSVVLQDIDMTKIVANKHRCTEGPNFVPLRSSILKSKAHNCTTDNVSGHLVLSMEAIKPWQSLEEFCLLAFFSRTFDLARLVPEARHIPFLHGAGNLGHQRA